MTGYRFSVDDKGTVYIIKLTAPVAKKEYPGALIYHSENCICESITNPNTGEELEQMNLSGILRTSVLYTKGKTIPGECWFCPSVDALYRLNYLSKGKDGLVKDQPPNRTLYDVLDSWIENCELTHDEVAAEMKISTTELLERINRIKQIDSISEQEVEAASIVAATNLLYSRKVDSGEIIPGWKKFLIAIGIEP